MCAGLRDFRSEACSARDSGQTRAIFRQKLRCAGCWVKSGELLSESKQNSFLGKLKRLSVINIKCAVPREHQCENRRPPHNHIPHLQNAPDLLD